MNAEPFSRATARSSTRRERVASAAALAAFCAALVVVGARHEPWFDEAQAWLIARDSSLLELLTQRLRYEGTPGLWHAILWVLMRAGLPYGDLWLVSATVAASGGFLVLRHAPFPAPMRIGCLASYVFGYQYAVVARSYALDLVLAPALAILFPSRLEHPLRYAALLALLANANAQSFVVAGVLAAEAVLAAERRGAPDGRSLGAVALYGAGALAAILQARPAPDVTFATGARSAPEILRVIWQVGEAFVDRLDPAAILGGVGPDPASVALGAVVSLALLVPSCLLFRRAGTLVLFASLIAALCSLAALLYANAWHAGFLFLAWILCLWVSWPAFAGAPPVFRATLLGSIALILGIQAVETALSWRDEIRSPYSAGRATAAYLGRLRAAQPGARVSAIGFKTFAVQPYANPGFLAVPGYYPWRGAGPIPADIDPAGLLGALRSLRPDAMLVSNAAGSDWIGPVAAEAGYCEAARFAGALIWKGYGREPDGIVILAPCRAVG